MKTPDGERQRDTGSGFRLMVCSGGFQRPLASSGGATGGARAAAAATGARRLRMPGGRLDGDGLVADGLDGLPERVVRRGGRRDADHVPSQVHVDLRAVIDRQDRLPDGTGAVAAGFSATVSGDD